MESNRDLFLLLAYVSDVYSGKALIKRLFNSLSNFQELFYGDIIPFKNKLNYNELERIILLKDAIRKINLTEIKNRLEKIDIKYSTYCDNDYPEKLKELSDSPFVLFYKGDLKLLKDFRTVAVVGTRNATSYGLNITKKISTMFSERNIIIISGLASGIDACAHEYAIKSGKTIAVLGTGLDKVYPASNRNLFNEILDKNSLVVSEYIPGTDGAPWNFPQRNRIISALSDAVIVVEGDVQSGALITARFAIKQNKPLFAVPGPLDSICSNGPNLLIKSRVAELLTSVDDVLEKITDVKSNGKQMEFDFIKEKVDLENLSERQKQIFKVLTKPKLIDEMISEMNLNIQELLSDISLLELKGYIEKDREGKYTKTN